MSSATGKSILVVEDDEPYRRLVVRMLDQAGYSVIAAEDFTSAIAVIESPTPIDLLLADIAMPAGTPHGMAIGRMAELRRRSLKVLYMSGTYDLGELSRFSSDAKVLKKPFTVRQLTDAVAEALG